MNILTIKEVASLGGKARWRGMNKQQRSDAMKKVRKGGKKLSTGKHKGVLTSKHTGV